MSNTLEKFKQYSTTIKEYIDKKVESIEDGVVTSVDGIKGDINLESKYVSIANTQNITGSKTFTSGITFFKPMDGQHGGMLAGGSGTNESSLILKGTSNVGGLRLTSSNVGGNNIKAVLLPENDNKFDLGTSVYSYKDIYTKGSLVKYVEYPHEVEGNKKYRIKTVFSLPESDFDRLTTPTNSDVIINKTLATDELLPKYIDLATRSTYSITDPQDTGWASIDQYGLIAGYRKDDFYSQTSLDTGNEGQILKSSGSTGYPTWIDQSDLVVDKASKDDEGNIIKDSYASALSLSDTSLLLQSKSGNTLSTLTQANLRTAIGTLPVSNGGTGRTTLTAYGLVVGNLTGTAQASLVKGTEGDVLKSGGDSAYPTWFPLLDGNNKILMSVLPDSILGQLVNCGTFVANTSVATLTNAGKSKHNTSNDTITLTNDNDATTGWTGSQNCYYMVSTAGTFAGIYFQVGDWLVATSNAWGIINNTDAVTSVFGRTGAVTLQASDVNGVGTISNNTTGNANTATKLNSSRTITLTGDVEGTVTTDLAGAVTIETTCGNSGGATFIDLECPSSVAASTASKAITKAGYTLKEGDIVSVKYVSGNTASSPTLNINATGDKPILLGGQVPTGSSGTGAHYVAANGVVMYKYDGTSFHQFGSTDITDANPTTDTYDRLYYSNAINVEPTLYRYKLIARGVDGKWYPLFTTDKTSTATQITTSWSTSIQEFSLSGEILWYNTTTNVTSNTTAVSNLYRTIPADIRYNINNTTLVDKKPLYLKGTIGPKGGFLPVQPSAYNSTNYYSQDLPTTQDGFLYMYLGYMYSADAMRLDISHPIYYFKNGQIKLYTGITESKVIVKDDISIPNNSSISSIVMPEAINTASDINIFVGVNDYTGSLIARNRYTVSGSTITFTEPLINTSGSTMWVRASAVVWGSMENINVPAPTSVSFGGIKVRLDGNTLYMSTTEQNA